MDTKLKSSRRSGEIIAVIVLICCTVVMLLFYPTLSRETAAKYDAQAESTEALGIVNDGVTAGNFILFSEAEGTSNSSDIMDEIDTEEFSLLRKYMDYEVFDPEGDAMLGTNTEAVLKKLNEEKNTEYAYRASLTFQSDGGLSAAQVNGENLDEKEQYKLEQDLLEKYANDTDRIELTTPYDVKIVYGITQKNLQNYIEENQKERLQELAAYSMMDSSLYQWLVLAMVMITALAALFIPCRKSFEMGEQKIFHAPFEVVFIGVCTLGASLYLPTRVAWQAVSGNEIQIVGNSASKANTVVTMLLSGLVWFVFFAAVYWAVTCLRAVFTMKRAYWRERTLCGRVICWMKGGDKSYGQKIKYGIREIWRHVKSFCGKLYDSLLHFNFRDRTNKAILKIIIINFVVLMVICVFWFYGLAALIIYSVVLFLFLRKYFNDIQAKYEILLKSTNQLASGNLDTPLEGDVGIFNPIQDELKKIQTGFKSAVDEEVKSERMKTELITNVSHDLKTPLTAIITYTDLLKNEKDEGKRKEYVDILERKSLRLKVLIEDLFEISKASSHNVTMNYMKVDIVDLLKQVGLENDSKIKAANLEFRWNLPDDKIVLWLDSQKTYRIFENLIVNITKYSLPHTRVYVDMTENENEVRIFMKNISAAELNFNTDEITDRFVRGDVSRNTEGSGLGLAIVKSFTELQHGKLKISTEADLFKAEIMLPKEDRSAEAH